LAEKVTAAPWEIPYPTSAGEVKVGATDFEELAERVTKIMKEKIGGVVKFATHAVSYNAVAGELGEATKALTATLPAAATVDQTIGVFSKVAAASELVKCTTSGGAFIEGDFITAASKTATIELTEGQHVVLTSDGTNWKILAGEPRRTAKYVAVVRTKAEVEAAGGIEPSATRPAHVVITAASELSVVEVEGQEILPVNSGTKSVGFFTFPKDKWKAQTVAANVTAATRLF
jgi:hypothetical protein